MLDLSTNLIKFTENLASTFVCNMAHYQKDSLTPMKANNNWQLPKLFCIWQIPKSKSTG